MRVYTVMLLQMMIWSGYTFMEWLSKHDQPVYNVIMFFVFFYLAVVVGNYIMKSAKKTLFTTILSLGLYASFHFTLAIM
ncbi:hypothetical protein [Bacillus sp. T33-2]|uniref:hypothetical protein n=1 Tax=Bacillus sp. T33-2 TaxID=2054168 RepID=UPI000C7794C4|nr:hypothetical protein [Bacillus sp. T33-2]PLR97444.1 hypothetical protein CVD19_08110 [Bacillus sp. T33-2]